MESPVAVAAEAPHVEKVVTQVVQETPIMASLGGGAANPEVLVYPSTDNKTLVIGKYASSAQPGGNVFVLYCGDKQKISIGRQSTCDVVIPPGTVSRQQAIFRRTGDGGGILSDTGTNPTQLNPNGSPATPRSVAAALGEFGIEAVKNEQETNLPQGNLAYAELPEGKIVRVLIGNKPITLSRQGNQLILKDEPASYKNTEGRLLRLVVAGKDKTLRQDGDTIQTASSEGHQGELNILLLNGCLLIQNQNFDKGIQVLASEVHDGLTVHARPEAANIPEDTRGFQIGARTIAEGGRTGGGTPDRNEDQLRVGFEENEGSGKNPFFVAIDGVSGLGYSGGDVAARAMAPVAQEILKRRAKTKDEMIAQLKEVHEKAREAVQKERNSAPQDSPGVSKADACYVAGKVVATSDGGQEVVLGMAGDVRAYEIMADGRLMLITRDEGIIKSLVRAGDYTTADETKLTDIIGNANSQSEYITALEEWERSVSSVEEKQKIRDIRTLRVWERRNTVEHTLMTGSPDPTLITHRLSNDSRGIMAVTDGVSDNLTQREMEEVIREVYDDVAHGVVARDAIARTMSERLANKAFARSKEGTEIHQRSKPDDVSCLIALTGSEDKADI